MQIDIGIKKNNNPQMSEFLNMYYIVYNDSKHSWLLKILFVTASEKSYL